MITEKGAGFWIEQLELLPHPEGGYYKEMYRSNVVLPKASLPKAFTGDRNVCTGIYYLLEAGDFSAFHRIASDEMWHFYAGEALEIFELTSAGELRIHQLGNDPSRGQSLQLVIPAGNWFASRPAIATSYSLVGCTVSPGFDFADFEMAERENLRAQFPEHHGIFDELTR